MKNSVYYKLITGVLTATVFCIGTAMSVMAGHWMANDVGYWYVHDDGTYPVYSWEWIDTDGDGIYQCYAFDENGYLYTNTTTPDGYTVGPDGAWFDSFQTVNRGFMHNAAVVPTGIAGAEGKVREEVEYTYASDGTVLVTNKYSSPKNNKNNKTNSSSKKNSSSSKSSTSSAKTSKTKTTTAIDSSEIVTSKIVTGGSSSNSGSSAISGDTGSSGYSGPDLDETSYDDGPSIPSNYSSQTVSPTTDESTIDASGPKNGGVIERDGYEDEDD